MRLFGRRLLHSKAVRKACISLIPVLFFLELIWRYNLPYGPFYRYEIDDGYKSRCCRTESVFDVCQWLPCQSCEASTNTLHIKKDSDNAFFVETSKSQALNTRQACAVESSALHNPNLKIFVLMTGNVNANTSTMQALKNYSNIKIRHIELGDYFLRTPLESWYFCSTWNYGTYAISHLSDALRFTTLYKYGGYYFDLDFVMIRSVENYRNFVAPESYLSLAAGAIHFEPDHPLTNLTVEEFRSTYWRGDWGYNGPLLLTRVMSKWCHVNNVSLMNHETCRGISTLSKDYFYPIYFDSWELFFQNTTKPSDLSGSLAAHVWNKMSKNSPVFKNSNQLYSQLVKANCPYVFAAAGDVF